MDHVLVIGSGFGGGATGVNPALTITALTEQAMSLWPDNGDPDPLRLTVRGDR